MTVKKSVPWYSERAGFFGPLYFVEYARALTPQRTRREVRFVIRTLGLRPGARILDLACGHGRHSVAFAREGLDVTGQDLNRFFLESAKEAARTEGVSVHFVRSDMRRIPFRSRFNAVVNLFTAFGYLGSDVEDAKVIQQVAKSLKPGGRFLIDTQNREWLMRHYRRSRNERLPSGVVVTSERRFDFETGRNQEIRTYRFSNGRKKVFKLDMRFYALNEVIRMLADAGLSYERAYGDFNGRPYSMDSRRMIVVARKP